jgi:hypothetical protein
MTTNHLLKSLAIPAILIIAFQFIRPVPNKIDQVSETDITKVVTVSDSVKGILESACFDCHSNNTNYPWYAYVQPVGWLLAKDIKKGKEALNFSEFAGYSSKRQESKLSDIEDMVDGNIMPLSSYKKMHKNARLSANEKAMIIHWAQQAADSLSR